MLSVRAFHNRHRTSIRLNQFLQKISKTKICETLQNLKNFLPAQQICFFLLHWFYIKKICVSICIKILNQYICKFCFLTVLDVKALDLITYVFGAPCLHTYFDFLLTLSCVCIIKFMFVRLANKYYYYYYHTCRF